MALQLGLSLLVLLELLLQLSLNALHVLHLGLHLAERAFLELDFSLVGFEFLFEEVQVFPGLLSLLLIVAVKFLVVLGESLLLLLDLFQFLVVYFLDLPLLLQLNQLPLQVEQLVHRDFGPPGGYRVVSLGDDAFGARIESFLG